MIVPQRNIKISHCWVAAVLFLAAIVMGADVFETFWVVFTDSGSVRKRCDRASKVSVLGDVLQGPLAG
jgi:hypothetical protein